MNSKLKKLFVRRMKTATATTNIENISSNEISSANVKL